MQRRTLLLGIVATGIQWFLNACTAKNPVKNTDDISDDAMRMSHPETSSPLPIISKPMTVFLDSQDTNKALLAPSEDILSSVLSDTHSFHVQLLPESNENGVTIHIQLASLPPESDQEAPFQVFQRESDETPFIEDTKATITLDREVSRARVRLVQSGEYIIGRVIPLALPSTLWFDDPPLFTSKPFGLLYHSGFGSREAEEVVKNLQKDIFSGSSLPRRGNQKVRVIFVHGMYQEHYGIWCRFDEMFDFFKSGLSDELKSFIEQWCIFFVFRYDSRKSIDENAQLLFDNINQDGVEPYLLIGHSMGGLLARFTHVLSYLLKQQGCLGVITLCTPHHGSPLAIPRWVRSVCSRMPFGAQLYILYLIAVNNFFAEIQFTTYSKKISIGMQMLVDTIFPKGFRCLFFDESEPGIPRLKFFSRFGRVPIQEELSSDDQYGVVCERALITTYIPDYEKKQGANGCRLNFVKTLTSLEEKAGISQIPFLTVHGGYFSDTYLKDAFKKGSDRLLNFVTSGSTKDRSSEFEEDALSIFGGFLFPLFPIVSQNTASSFMCNDGLVPLASQLFLKDGPPLVRNGSKLGSFGLNEDSLEKRLPSITRAHYFWKDISHAAILKSRGNNEIFTQLVQDIRWYVDALHAQASYEFTTLDQLTIENFVRGLFNKNHDETFIDSDGSGITSRVSSVTSISIISDKVIPDTVLATCIVTESITVYQNGTSRNRGSGTTTYRIYFGRVRGVWFGIGY